MRRQNLVRAEAWVNEKEITQEPAPLLHRRGLSEQSQATTHTMTSSQSHISPHATEPSLEMHFAGISPESKSAHIHQRLGLAATSPPTATESSSIHTRHSHATPLHRAHKASREPVPNTPALPVASSALVSSTTSLTQESPVASPAILSSVLSLVTSPSRARRRLQSPDASSSSLPRARVNSIPRPPDTPPVSTEDVEQRLLELRNEAERGLAEIRAQRTGSGENGEMPPPYHSP
jgi:hypothetical protein